jgi:hypothetical protein
MKKKLEVSPPLYQNGEIYDAPDLQIVLLGLKRQGYDIHVSSVDATRLRLTCNKTKNRFVVECVGHNDWPAGYL